MQTEEVCHVSAHLSSSRRFLSVTIDIIIIIIIIIIHYYYNYYYYYYYYYFYCYHSFDTFNITYKLRLLYKVCARDWSKTIM